MGDMLSQAEIDALLNGTPEPSISSSMEDDSTSLTYQEIDALGEIGNICMGTSATTLFTLLDQKVTITSPKVTITTWDEISKEYVNPFIAVRVEYTIGLTGSNLLILKEHDVRVIADLMMGGDGNGNLNGELSELHLSAISEAMNQMVGSSSTSMSSMFNKRIGISPPKTFQMEFGKGQTYIDLEDSQKIVVISFKMIVGTLIDSEIMQILPISFAKNLVDSLLNMDVGGDAYTVPQNTESGLQLPRKVSKPPQGGGNQSRQPSQSNKPDRRIEPSYNQEYDSNESWNTGGEGRRHKEPVNVQPAQFQSFDEKRITLERKNISLIMDVQLQVTVELGRTQKLIKDILEFGPGSIIELDKLAGEPIDILVNGKAIAKGEVVVIDESFGVRITDIIHPSKRL